MQRRSLIIPGILWMAILHAVTDLKAAPPAPNAKPKSLRAGAAMVDISPRRFPVIVNGGFLESKASRLNDPVHARALVLDDGSTRIAIVVVDTCMMPRDLIDQAKNLANTKTSIPVDHMLISATHTHSAPAVMGALGCRADTAYAADLIPMIADAITRAAANLEPARAGWSKIDDSEHTFCRRWIRRPDKLIDDPFGQRNVRANMHPGYQNPDVIAPSGPVDPALTLLSIQSQSGRPLAVLANYSMHYYGTAPVSADYFGRFANTLAKLIDVSPAGAPFVAIMSQGTSGDQMWMDYGKPQAEQGVDAYATAVAEAAFKAYQTINYADTITLATAQQTLTLDRRVPDESRLKWAKQVVAAMAKRDEIPRTVPEVYAQEAIFLHDQPRRELELQAFRIGELGITAIPNEVFAITGLKLKAQSPFDLTMNIELANGSEGYIPPPEQHALGGYTTWPARTAALEVNAEPKIVEALLSLLEKVASKPRRAIRLPSNPYAEAIMKSQPQAYWRLDDIAGKSALDSSPHAHHATYVPGIAFYLTGVDTPGLLVDNALNRCVHFAGGRLKSELNHPSGDYSVELWFWNGLTPGAPLVGTPLFALDAKTGDRSSGDQVGIAALPGNPGKLYFSCLDAAERLRSGKTTIAPKTWHHLSFVRQGKHVTLYLDGSPEIDGDFAQKRKAVVADLVVGGSFVGKSGFEGKIDEVAVFDRSLTAQEIAAHYAAAH